MRARVREIASQANIDHDIEAMPMAYETLVGDMGSVLSHGQLQRILLARALYGRPAILMIDEGTSNLDPENETTILETIADMSITRIAIAHSPPCENLRFPAKSLSYSRTRCKNQIPPPENRLKPP